MDWTLPMNLKSVLCCLSLCLYFSVSHCLLVSVSSTGLSVWLCIYISLCSNIILGLCSLLVMLCISVSLYLCVSLSLCPLLALLYVSVPGTSPHRYPRGSMSDEHCVNVCCTVRWALCTVSMSVQCVHNSEFSRGQSMLCNTVWALHFVHYSMSNTAWEYRVSNTVCALQCVHYSVCITVWVT